MVDATNLPTCRYPGCDFRTLGAMYCGLHDALEERTVEPERVVGDPVRGLIHTPCPRCDGPLSWRPRGGRDVFAEAIRQLELNKEKDVSNKVGEQFVPKQDFAFGKRMDITNEAWREYVFPNGTYRIASPKAVIVKQSASGGLSHRVVDQAGTVHYVPSGWLALRWTGHNGEALEF